MSNKLPLGLTRYGGKTFEKLHACGSGCLTASMLPDLFNVGRRGKLALAAHVSGLIDMSPKDNNLLRRGHLLQPVAAKMYAAETGKQVRSIHARVKHDDMNFYASPDTLERVGSNGSTQWHPGEIKVIAKDVYEAEWKEAGPPARHLIQHQGQLLLTGAPVGPVIALVIDEHDMFLKHWQVEANATVQAVIEDEVRDFLDMLAKGELPDPDMNHAGDQEALIRLARAHLQDVVELSSDLRHHAQMYKRLGKVANKVEKKRKAHKAWLVKALDGHVGGVIRAPEDEPEAVDWLIEMKSIEMEETTRKAHVQNRIYIKDHGRKVRQLDRMITEMAQG